ncbi:SIS domain-containing protein [Thermoflexus sp.]|uniref:SIS domain-containing protein n=1 Tax=Thermoflexus sp. TaxID=1969742 RepID=UPI0025D7695B|nr:SIS domain-containing protein [Thermoflexus sp.]MDW8180278.1 SIS domain-containing protein [Anaerolineae bacterium]MCS6963558.1 SIS domain-containing protein [Thermoflexus sp.]MCS7350827.1 SIS domain-containing protein [Thermoflexus sp.]MCX7690365.1 SIS domain-containing protein [Thermoflexus sp.]MDW8185004.1 SIS domain-containing protein [Anaerolineae bacterium]
MSHTLREILSQPAVWESALAEARRAEPEWRAQLDEADAPILFVGCGSTYYLSQTAAALFRRLTGREALALPAGELLLYAEDWLGDRRDGSPMPVLVAISRSGVTTETVRAAEIHRDRGGRVLAVTNEPGSPLAALADTGLFLPAGQESSVVQTRSFTSMLVGLNALAAWLSGREDLWEAMQRLPEAAEGLIRRYQELAQSVGADLSADRFYFLGSGARYGLASEASLKMKEVSLSHSEPFPFLEFRHGPMSMVDGSTVLFGLLSGRHRAHEQAVLEEMRALGARVFSLADRGADIAFESDIPEDGAYALFLPFLQLVAVYRAVAKGLDPDRPNHLSRVVTLNLEEV